MPEKSGLSAKDAARIEQEVLALDEKVREAKSWTDASATVKFHKDIFADALIDIHASGWIYTKKDSVELERNIASTPRDLKVVRFTNSERKVAILSPDVVVVTSLNETYFEVPNPQDLAMKAGTLSMSPKATRAAAAAMLKNPVFGPGEDYAPNPYRVRITRIWARQNGKWKLALSQATRIGKRVRPGH